LRALLAKARAEGLKVSIAGARHTMGGHTLYPGGIAIDMLTFKHMQLDETSNVLTVGAGAKWSEIIPYLNERGRSVAVMQSNSSFSVGGSISANCHGWQTGKPPIASTVESFTLMRADGEVTTCSRTENRELFSLVLGGYGLFGIILEVKLHVVPNEQYRRVRQTVKTGEYAQRIAEVSTSSSAAAMLYGRMDITAENFLRSVILNVWERVPDTSYTSTPLRQVPAQKMRRAIFRGSVGSEYGKRLRWWTESHVDPQFGKGGVMRNDLLDVGVELFENRSESDTDILHEYFVPPGQFAKFVERVRDIVPRHGADLLNVTVRDVQPDNDSFLRYADGRMLCLVMLFNQQRTPEAEGKMRTMTQELIDAALECGGRYYLPYRLHATPEQLHRAYPQAREFFNLKRKYDTEEIFQNEFYRRYGKL